MEEDAKSQDGGDETLLFQILKLNKLHVLLYFSMYLFIHNMFIEDWFFNV